MDIGEYEPFLAIGFSTPPVDQDIPPTFGTLLSCVSVCMRLLLKVISSNHWKNQNQRKTKKEISNSCCNCHEVWTMWLYFIRSKNTLVYYQLSDTKTQNPVSRYWAYLHIPILYHHPSLHLFQFFAVTLFNIIWYNRTRTVMSRTKDIMKHNVKRSHVFRLLKQNSAKFKQKKRV